MFQQFLSESPLIVWPLAAFGIFFATFLVVCVYLAAGAVRKKNFDHVAHLPLEDDASGSARGEA